MSHKTPAILIVDDEEMVLSSLKGVFGLHTDYRIHQAASPRDAIAELERSPIDVVISDFLMPEMNGIELLKEVRRLQPDSMRLLLTGYADKENAIRAINDVGLYHYLEKPWDNDALLNIVRNALSEKSLRQRLEQKVRELDSLASEHTELESRHRSLERDLEMAANVQRGLLPKEFPALEDYRFSHVYQPCTAVGGDFFDVRSNDAGTFLLVADVIGHGVKAALTTMLLKGIFQESASTAEEPVELLSEMNRRLGAVLPSGMYAAAAAFLIRDGVPQIPFSNAGLPYPFVLRREKRLDEIALAGPPLGLFEWNELPYEARTIALSPGDVLLAGSDGLGTIANGAGALFEDDELRRVLRELAGEDGETVVEETMKRALAFGNGSPIPDDINMVAVTRA